MLITFQAQIDPLDPYEFTIDERETMHGLFMDFVSGLEQFKQYLRADMYVDKEQFIPRYLRTK